MQEATAGPCGKPVCPTDLKGDNASFSGSVFPRPPCVSHLGTGPWPRQGGCQGPGLGYTRHVGAQEADGVRGARARLTLSGGLWLIQRM